MNRKLIIPAVLLLLAQSPSVRAECCGAPSQEPGDVARHAKLTALLAQQHAAIMSALASYVGPNGVMDMSVQGGARGIVDAIKANTEANAKSNNALAIELKKAMKEQETARNVREAYDRYGPQRLSRTICTQLAASKGASSGARIQRDAAASTMAAAREYDRKFKTHAQVLSENANRRPEDFKPDAIMTTGYTMTPQEKQATDNAIKMLVNPFPKPQQELTAAQLKTGAGKEYKLLNDILNMRYDMSRIPLAESEASAVASISATAQHRESLQEIYGTVPPNKIVDGKVSKDVDLEIRALKYSTPKSLIEIGGSDNEVQLLQKITEMMTVQTELDYRNYQKLTQLTNLVAVMQAEDARNNFEPKVDHARTAARRSAGN